MIIELCTEAPFAGVPIVEAWRVFDPQRRDTGTMEIDCPYCGQLHRHSANDRARGANDGHRSAHCARTGDGLLILSELFAARVTQLDHRISDGYLLREIGSVVRDYDARKRYPERVPIPPKLRAFVLERDGFRCRRCGADPRVARLVLDHVVPVARGGRTIADNLQTLCELCNQGKSDASPHSHDLRR